ncbi:MAG TPA: DUF2079 domain-containing protein [Streptosporangiaceae bacterium]|nr:DUF2079 domain-containing protein [Streptosporangiaceae bacterium]
MGFRTTKESALLAARQAPGERAASRQPGHGVAVGVLTFLVAAAYSGFALALYHTFVTSSYDLVIFDQAVRSYAHFQPGISIIKGVHNGFGPHFSILGDHWSPILAALAPLYWIYNGPQALLLAQAVLFALAIPPLWVFTRRAFGGGNKATVAAYLVSVAYALSWPIASALAFDFHEVAFVPVLTVVALERLQAGRLRTALIALAALLLVKEDMGLFVAGIGLYLAVARPRTLPRQLLVGGGLMVAGVAATFIATYVLIPAMGGRAGYYWAYSDLGSNVPQVVGHLITHPGSLRQVVTPRVKLYTVLWLFGAFCFLPLRSPMALAAIPLLLERMLANIFPGWWGTSLQYNAFLVMLLACAAVDGAARLDRSRLARRLKVGGTWTVALGGAAAMCAVAVVLVPHFAFGPALHPAFYQRDANARAAAAADAVVPAGVTVAAVDNLGPQLSARDTVLLWDGDGSTPPLGTPWVVANTAELQFTFRSVREQRQRVALLERSGYKVVFRRLGYIVLHRGGPATGTARG